jgi:hypothetical protein
VNYTTGTNGFQVYVPTRGTSYDIWATNLTYRFLQSK